MAETGERRVYRPSLLRRVLGWGFILVCGGALSALAGYVVGHWTTTSVEDRWAALGIGAFLLALALLGALSLRSFFVLGPDYVEIVRPFGTKRFTVSELGGFGLLTLVVNLVPLRHVRVYAYGPKEVTRLPLSLGTEAEVERWFRERLPLVVDGGSIALPRPRYFDAAGEERERAHRTS